MYQLEKRFPGFATLAPGSQLQSFMTGFSVLPIDAQFLRTLALKRCYLASNAGTVVRPRYIKFLFAESREADVQEFTEDLGQHMNIPDDELMGVRAVPEGRLEALLLAAGFASLYLQDVEETTLTQFLSNHQEAIERAFAADSVFFEQTLPWIDGDHDNDETSIRPDIIARRKAGSWLIIDFKLPLLDKSRITTGKRARRKFIYTVNDGISQLFRYAEYFNSPANQATAAETLGETISDPNLALVVGTSENVDLAEVDQAKRSYKPIDIIDYDTLIRLSLANDL